jgi:cysteine desulfurase
VMVYLDWNATAPPLDEALAAMDEAGRVGGGNPSSVHSVGRRALAHVEDAREAIGRLCERSPRDVFLTSGGTEANNLAIRSLAQGASLIIASRLEHPSVVRVVEALGVAGTPVCWIEPDADGLVQLESIDRGLATCRDPARALVCLQAANHETGVLQPVQDAIELVQRAGARIHVDAVQAFGKMSARAWREADTISVAAHKIRGPKGIGAVVAGPCAGLQPLLLGGGQEYGIRPGTSSAALAAGFRIAAEWAIRSNCDYDAIRPLRDRLEKCLVALGGVVNGSRNRLPHVTNVSFLDLRGDELVAGLDIEGVCVSSGSACSSGASEMSPVIAAMGGETRARGAVRTSLGDTTSEEEIEFAIGAWNRVIGRARVDEALLEADP